MSEAKNTDSQIDAIVEVMNKRERWLSDGFGYYLPADDWLPSNDNLTVEEMKENSLRQIAREILEAVNR